MTQIAGIRIWLFRKSYYLFTILFNSIFYPASYPELKKTGMDRLIPGYIRFSWKTGFWYLWNVKDTQAFFKDPDWGTGRYSSDKSLQ